MTTNTSVATVRRRVSDIVINTPPAADNVPPAIRFNEQEQINSTDGVRYVNTYSYLYEVLEGDEELTLYDSSAVPEESADLSDMTLEDFMALDNPQTTDANLPVKGTFKYQDLEDILYSIYVHLSMKRNNPPEEPELEVNPENSDDPEAGGEV
jgi:hypothetical protein